jgi:hypothetical protein
MSMGRKELCGDHTARITNLEGWIGRIDKRMWAVLVMVAGTLGTSLFTVIMLYVKRP